jgi:hypothetical protein
MGAAERLRQVLVSDGLFGAQRFANQSIGNGSARGPKVLLLEKKCPPLPLKGQSSPF